MFSQVHKQKQKGDEMCIFIMQKSLKILNWIAGKMIAFEHNLSL